MYWKILPIPDKTILKKPSYKAVIISFIIIATPIYTYSLTLPAEQKISLLLFTLPILALLLFLCISFLYIRYQHSVITYNNWENERDTTKKEWRNWCQSSVSSLASVTYTPDKEGADVFLKETEAIPMFPDKPRRLFKNQEINEDLFLAIDRKIESQCHNYRFYLSGIYLIDSSKNSNNKNKIYNQWHIQPIQSPLYQEIFSIYDSKNSKTFLVITIQSEGQYSEFVSAQVFSSDRELVNLNTASIKIERVMEIDKEDIDNEIIKYIDYSGISRNKPFQTWVTKAKQEVIDNILITYSKNNIGFDKHHPIFSLTLSYSTPHPNAFLTYLSLVTEIAEKTKTDQVLIHINPDNSGYAVYISSRS